MLKFLIPILNEKRAIATSINDREKTIPIEKNERFDKNHPAIDLIKKK